MGQSDATTNSNSRLEKLKNRHYPGRRSPTNLNNTQMTGRRSPTNLNNTQMTERRSPNRDTLNTTQKIPSEYNRLTTYTEDTYMRSEPADSEYTTGGTAMIRRSKQHRKL